MSVQANFKRPVAVSLLSGSLLLFGFSQAEVEKSGDAGFVELFNGRDLDGWEVVGDPKAFEVRNGIIRSEVGGNWMYYKEKKFSDFVLRVEWRISERGNSGVYIRAPLESKPWETAYEIQISCEKPPRDDLRCTGALYGYQAVNPRPQEIPDKWRTFEIECRGPWITVKLDGETICRLDQSTKPETKGKPLVGFVGVQDGHAGHWVEYRSIQIRELNRNP